MHSYYLPRYDSKNYTDLDQLEKPVVSPPTIYQLNLEDCEVQDYFKQLSLQKNEVLRCDASGKITSEGDLNNLISWLYQQILTIKNQDRPLHTIQDNLTLAYETIRLLNQQQKLYSPIFFKCKRKIQQIFNGEKFADEKMELIQSYAVAPISIDLLAKIFSFLPLSNILDTWPLINKGRKVHELTLLFSKPARITYYLWLKLCNVGPYVITVNPGDSINIPPNLSIRYNNKCTFSIARRVSYRKIKRSGDIKGWQYYQSSYFFKIEGFLSKDERKNLRMYLSDIVKKLNHLLRKKLPSYRQISKETFLASLD